MGSQFRPRLRRDSNPVYRFSSPRVSSGVGLVRPRHDRCKLDLFLFYAFFSASTGFVLPYRRNEQLSAGPASDQPWPSTDWSRVESVIKMDLRDARCEWSKWHHELHEIEKGLSIDLGRASLSRICIL